MLLGTFGAGLNLLLGRKKCAVRVVGRRCAGLAHGWKLGVAGVSDGVALHEAWFRNGTGTQGVGQVCLAARAGFWVLEL